MNVRSSQSSAPPPWLGAVTVSEPDADAALPALWADVRAPAAIVFV